MLMLLSLLVILVIPMRLVFLCRLLPPAFFAWPLHAHRHVDHAFSLPRTITNSHELTNSSTNTALREVLAPLLALEIERAPLLGRHRLTQMTLFPPLLHTTHHNYTHKTIQTIQNNTLVSTVHITATSQLTHGAKDHPLANTLFQPPFSLTPIQNQTHIH